MLGKTFSWQKMLGLAAFLTLGFSAVNAQAGFMVCGDAHRSVSFNSADDCQTGEGNPQVGDINADFPNPGNWTHVGGIDAGNPTNSLFSLSFTSGGFGQTSAAGTWTIDSSYWENYGAAVLSFHVGSGSVLEPDYFAFLVTPGTLSGTWSYTRSDSRRGAGGGFSNMHLWGAGEPLVKVVEPSPLLLFGFGLLGLGLIRRKAQ